MDWCQIVIASPLRGKKIIFFWYMTTMEYLLLMIVVLLSKPWDFKGLTRRDKSINVSSWEFFDGGGVGCPPSQWFFIWSATWRCHHIAGSLSTSLQAIRAVLQIWPFAQVILICGKLTRRATITMSLSRVWHCSNSEPQGWTQHNTLLRDMGVTEMG